MRRFSLSLGLFIVLMGLVSIGSIAHADTFDVNLKYGAQGSRVIALQEFLVDNNYCDVPTTGYFYSLTLACVKAFQTKENINPVSGYFGILSRTRANSILSSLVSDSDSAEQSETGKVSSPVIQLPTVQVVSTPTNNNPAVPAPSSPLPFTVTTQDTTNGSGATYIIPSRNDIVMDAITYKLPYKYNDPSGKLYSCGDLLDAWASYPYPCPRDTDNGVYETKSSVDNYGRATPFDLISYSTDQYLYMPLGTTVYYYHGHDLNGQVYEYHN